MADSIDALGEIEVQDLVLHTHTDFDTAAGFDVQFLLGAGAGTTLTDLIGHGHADIARELLAYPELHEDLQAWTAFRRSYFYGHG